MESRVKSIQTKIFTALKNTATQVFSVLSVFPYPGILNAVFLSNVEEEHECSLVFFNFYKLKSECIES